MGVNDDDFEMPGYCWAQRQRAGTRCLREPGHAGDHHNWHTNEWWPRTAADKAPAQATD